MNSNVKSNTNTASNVTGSFTTAKNVVVNTANNMKNAAVNAVNTVSNTMSNAVNTVSNAASNATNSVKNTFNSSAFSDITEPINDSFQEAVDNGSSSMFTVPLMITLGVLAVVFILLIVFRDQVAFGLSVAWEKIKNLFSSAPPAPVPAPAPAQPAIDNTAVNNMLPGRKQVFNVALDKYTYSDAEPLCKAFGAELATYDQVKDAWNKGADWCNYGWVKGQSAVYPTQQATYDKLQAGPESQRMSCGIPGVNGGYFDNPELRMGVNCYGNKPSENDTDIRYEEKKKQNLTPDALEYDKKVQNYKVHMDEIPVNPFMTGKWSS